VAHHLSAQRIRAEGLGYHIRRASLVVGFQVDMVWAMCLVRLRRRRLAAVMALVLLGHFICTDCDCSGDGGFEIMRSGVVGFVVLGLGYR